MNRLLEVLRKLRGSIFKDFIGFVSWKNGKRQPEVLTLLVYLEKHHPRFKEKAVDSEVICKKLKIKNLSAASHRAIDILGRYLVYKHLENEDNQFDLLLAEVYHGMQIHSIANLAMGRVERKLKEEKPIGKLDGFYRFLVGDFLTTSQQGGPKHEINPHMQYAVDALDHFYWEKKLRYSCELANRKRVINADYHNHMIKQIVAFLDKNPSDDNIKIRIYLIIYKALMDNQPVGESYQALCALVDENHDIFPTIELYELYEYTLNICTKMVNLGHPDYFKQIIAINQKLDKIGRWDAHVPTSSRLLNVILAAFNCSEEEEQWAEYFVEKYSTKLPEEKSTVVMEMWSANTLFREGKSAAALRMVNVVNKKLGYNNPNQVMSMKILELKVLYEMEEIAELREFADNFRRYVRKANKISQERQSLVVKLAGYVARLAEALPSEKEKLNKLLSQVEQEILPGKDWLINAIIAKIKGRKK